jgi:predicted dehydrogenase
MQSGCVGVLQSTAGDWGPPIIQTRVTGSRGTAWIDGVGSKVLVADVDGTRLLPVADDLPTGAPEPLPDGLLHTAYDRMIAHGMDLGPYTCLAVAFRELILGRPLPPGPRPATFADGVAGMVVLDAVRQAAAEHTWVEIEG